MENFSERIKFLRTKKNIKQIEMAKILNCTERHYQRYESNKSHPDFYGLIFIADYFDVSLDYLVGRSDDPKRR